MADFIEQFEEEPKDNEVIQDEEVVDNINDVNSEQEPEPELPAKYKGKSAADIAKMHQELEKLMGRQAQEVGELRKLTDEVLKSQLKKSQQEEETQEIDIFADPEKFVEKKVANHPDVVAAREAAETMRKQQALQRLAEEHPDYQQVVNDADFTEWVLASNIRKKLFAEANANFDLDAASELLSTYKELKGRKKAAEVEQISNDMKAVSKQARQAATVDSGGAGEVTKKIYRRADLIRLRMTDPARYEALGDEIMLAYQEGRVK